ncbi:peptide chain release factor 1 [Engelhardtia mirabilis]|uniref:Peptide chain release factor 1 n=1 Tax=Engelhardtia mirabilis TaxID=2528011 RepID=A0A518BLV9_9BACT|nr:Peptide chain release factor RF1 [Planctomycetes bacterium Pla133]QDV02280.1 Peptide chain release factor RF1 [Planctomycetes bacterium Pla86]
MGVSPTIASKLAQRAARYAELTSLLADPEVAGAPKRYSEALRERGMLERSAELFEELQRLRSVREDAEAILDEPDADDELADIAREDLDGLDEKEEALEHRIKGELVKDDDLLRTKVIVEVRAGTGGDEATLFVGDLYTMYSKYIEARHWRKEVIDISPTEVGGIKDVTFAVEGEGAWNLLRFESGGHRVQRVPSTESQGRIHTSAATVAVLPEAEEVDVDLRDEDLRIDTMRAGGPGGQSVNTTSSAVRITHLPTGTVVQCQDEKSQHKNKAKAMRVLRSRLFEAERQRVHDARAAERKEQVGSGDRSQRVRTYNFPQNRVSDHRLGANFSLESIVGGRLDPLLEQLVEQDREERIARL